LNAPEMVEMIEAPMIQLMGSKKSKIIKYKLGCNMGKNKL